MSIFIEDHFYLSEDQNVDKALELTGLALDELEAVVGRFRKNSHRAGKLRGEILVYLDGRVKIRHHFSKKKLWESCNEN